MIIFVALCIGERAAGAAVCVIKEQPGQVRDSRGDAPWGIGTEVVFLAGNVK